MEASLVFYLLSEKFKIAFKRTKIKLKNLYKKYSLAGFQSNFLFEKVIKKVQKHLKFILFYY